MNEKKDGRIPRKYGPIIITGTSGLLGGYLFMRWSRSGFFDRNTNDIEIYGFDRNVVELPNTYEIDITDHHAVSSTIKEIQPKTIINCAAMTNVDACQEDRSTAMNINSTAVRNLRDAGEDVNARLIQISTDAVLGDHGILSYTESDRPIPINVYGSSKHAGEIAALSSDRNLVLRTTIFGWNMVRKKGSFGEWLYKVITEHQRATVFSDVHFSPIYIGYFADLLEVAIIKGIAGLYHLAGADAISKETFAREMARQMGLPDDNLATGTVANLPFRAPRAHNMALDSTRFAERCAITLPDHRESIAAFLAEAPSP